MAHNAETQRLQRLARGNWASIYATAVDADVWGQVDDAMAEYEKYVNNHYLHDINMFYCACPLSAIF